MIYLMMSVRIGKVDKKRQLSGEEDAEPMGEPTKEEGIEEDAPTMALGENLQVRLI